MNRLVKLSLWLACVCAAISGCSSSPEPAEPKTAAPTPVAAKKIEPALAAGNVKAPAGAAKSEAAKPKIAAFTPPFPKRTEMFQVPQREKGAARRENEPGETVELKGFINVGRPLAVLSIDGVIAPIPEGGEKYGVLVRSINPPSVDLQRGRQSWRATLE